MNIPSLIHSMHGCKSPKNIDRFFIRTAGMFYIFRPCGIRLSHFEMYTAESVSDIFRYLIDVFGENPSNDHLRGVCYDRSCDLHPFISNLAANGNLVAEKYSSMHYLVDTFHVEKHTTGKCVLTSKDCQYHPQPHSRFEYLQALE